MRRLALGLCVLSLVLGCARQKQEPLLPKAAVVARIDSSLTSLVPKGFAGAVLLVDHGDTLLSKAYGLADRATGRPMTPQTGFDIGSLVKPITMAAILKLQSQGQLRLADKLILYFPDAPSDKASITIDQLLRHRSGLPDIVDSASNPIRYTQDFDYEPVAREEIVRRAMKAKLVFAPDSREQYSNLGYSLLGVIVEKASGKPFETYVQQEILGPAGMTHTGYLVPGWKKDGLAVGYIGERPWGTPLDHPWLSDGPSWNLRGNGGMLSTTGDLAKWIAALGAGTVLPKPQQDEFLAMAVHKNQRGTRTFGPSGGNDVFNACYLWYLDENRAIVVLTSTDRFKAEDLVPQIAHEMRRIEPGAAGAPSGVSLDRAKLAASITGIATEAQPGVLGVGVQVLGTSESWYLDADRPLPMQSVFKAPLAACVLDAADHGALKLDSTLVLTKNDLSVQYSPIADAFPARTKWTIQELLERAVETSDNTAADVLLRLIGGPFALTAWLNGKGIEGIRVDRYEHDLQPAIWGLGSFEPAWSKQKAFDRAKETIPLALRRKAVETYLRGEVDSMTPRGGIAFLDALSGGRLVSPASTARLLEMMTKAMTGPNRLRAGLPAGARLAHKTGTGPTVLGIATATNDIGIVTLADGRRVAIVALLSASAQAEAGRDSTIANVARQVVASVQEMRP